MDQLPYYARQGAVIRRARGDNVARIVGTYDPEAAQRMAESLNVLMAETCIEMALGVTVARQIAARF